MFVRIAAFAALIGLATSCFLPQMLPQPACAAPALGYPSALGYGSPLAAQFLPPALPGCGCAPPAPAPCAAPALSISPTLGLIGKIKAKLCAKLCCGAVNPLALNPLALKPLALGGGCAPPPACY